VAGRILNPERSCGIRMYYRGPLATVKLVLLASPSRISTISIGCDVSLQEESYRHIKTTISTRIFYSLNCAVQKDEIQMRRLFRSIWDTSTPSEGRTSPPGGHWPRYTLLTTGTPSAVKEHHLPCCRLGFWFRKCAETLEVVPYQSQSYLFLQVP
jgi:hypothetical protein